MSEAIDPTTGLQRFAPLNQHDPFYSDRQRFYSTVQHQIESGENFPVDPIWQEDEMAIALGRLAMPNVDGRKNPMITDDEAMSILTDWLKKRRPDLAVIKVAPKPRGYGRGYLNE